MATTKSVQPIAWTLSQLPEAWESVYMLRLPDEWRKALAELPKIDDSVATTTLHLAIRASAPEIVHWYSYVFQQDPQKRSPFWLASAQPIDVNKLRRVMQVWFELCYGQNPLISDVINVLYSISPEWQSINLSELRSEDCFRLLPYLAAQTLTRQGFRLQLSAQDGRVGEFDLKLCPDYGSYYADVDLITWPPEVAQFGRQPYYYSYYLHLRARQSPNLTDIQLQCVPGIRRWVSLPLAEQKLSQFECYLPFKRRHTVYAEVEGAAWLSARPIESTLIQLQLVRFDRGPIWGGKLAEFLHRLTHNYNIPTPADLLLSPDRYVSQLAIAQNSLLALRHRVGRGLEARDRYEIYAQLTNSLPTGFNPASPWQATKTYLRQTPSYASKLQTQIPSDARQAVLEQIALPLKIEVAAENFQQWETAIRAELGVIHGASLPLEIEIVSAPLPDQMLGELSVDKSIGLLTQWQSRIQEIRQSVSPAHCNTGTIIEMINYSEKYGRSSSDAERDPKKPVKFGLAHTGRVSQNVTPKQSDEDEKAYKARQSNAIRDLLRQMGWRLNPLYNGFKSTTLPSLIDVVGFLLIQLNASGKQFQTLKLPLAVQWRASDNKTFICLPGPAGPEVLPYTEALLAASRLQSTGTTTDDDLRIFFARAAENLGLMTTNAPTLLVVHEGLYKNVTRLYRELRVTRPGEKVILSGMQPFSEHVRIARLRYSSDGDVPSVCLTENFGKFSGMFGNKDHSYVFYSFQERAHPPKLPKNRRQRDNWQEHSWNPSTAEISLYNLKASDVSQEWAWVVHRLRQESSHVESATLLPEPLHTAAKIQEYLVHLGS